MRSSLLLMLLLLLLLWQYVWDLVVRPSYPPVMASAGQSSWRNRDGPGANGDFELWAL